MLNNLSIRTRLIFLIGYLCLSMLVGGAMGIYMLTSSNDVLKTIYQDSYSKINELNSISRQMNQNQMLLARIVMGKLSKTPDTDAVTDRFVQAFSDNCSGVSQGLARLKRYEWQPEEQALLEGMEDALTHYKASGVSEVLAALHSGQYPDAASVLQGSAHELQITLNQQTDLLVQLEFQNATLDYQRAQHNYNLLRALAIVLTLVGMVVATGFGVWIMRSITLPLAEAVRTAKRVASGDLSEQVRVSGSHNEIDVLLQAMREMTHSLHNMIGQVHQVTEIVLHESENIATGVDDLAHRTEQQANSLSNTAESTEHMTGTVKQNTESAHHALKVAGTTREIADAGGKTMQEVVLKMAEISTSSRKIVDIISVIEGIAFQTNILALNAAVEAARAGEQGRGFAVVAGEVRNLAQRSSAAAKEIKSLIDHSVNSVKAGSNLVQQAGDNMEEILTVVGLFSDLLETIYQASSQQSTGIATINQSIAEMDNMTQQNAALVEQAAAAAQNMRNQAAILEKAVSMFKLGNLAGSASYASAQEDASGSLPANEPEPTSTFKQLSDIESVGEEWHEF